MLPEISVSKLLHDLLVHLFCCMFALSCHWRQGYSCSGSMKHRIMDVLITSAYIDDKGYKLKRVMARAASSSLHCLKQVEAQVYIENVLIPLRTPELDNRSTQPVGLPSFLRSRASILQSMLA
eukprot:scaffold18081_cov18-Tisochrysis_lutea.AAC.1